MPLLVHEMLKSKVDPDGWRRSYRKNAPDKAPPNMVAMGHAYRSQGVEALVPSESSRDD